MISLNPTDVPAQTSDIYALLTAIIANPIEAKKRLDELVAAGKANQEAAENARLDRVQAAADHAAAKSKLAAATKISADFDANHEIRTRQLDEQNSSLVATDTRLRQYEAQVAAREKALGEPLTARERAIAAREQELNDYEAGLKIREAAIDEFKAALDKKAERMKEAANG